jgi:homoserine dehydrogenase
VLPASDDAPMTAGVIVLKFGGSVLRSATAYAVVATEIARWRADGLQVVAVVSAQAGRTDALLAECHAGEPSPFAVAARAALGELESASLLGLELDRRRIDAAVLDPAALGLRAVGPPLDADPVDVETGRMRAVLQRHGTAVVPGFVAVDGARRTVLLGRGGSDLTALFLAQRLCARCRLLKDVPGLLAPDARTSAPLPAADYEAVLALGGRLVQPKAIAFARAHAVRFELAALGAAAATVVGPAARGDTACG